MNDRIKRLLGDSENRRFFEQERLILWATEAVTGAMKRACKSKVDIASELGTSRAHITQVLSGSRNMTLRTLADLAYACDSRVRVDFEPLRTGKFLEHPIRVVKHSKPKRITVLGLEDEKLGAVSGDMAA